MTDLLEKEITGGPVMVAIRGSERALAYPMYAVILYKQKTGDSLFDATSWLKIDLQADPERWLACLWAGLHEQQADKSWKAPFTLEELGGLVAFDNAPEISIAMVRALTSYMPKPKEPAAETEKKTATPEANPLSNSASSMPALADDLALPGPNS